MGIANTIRQKQNREGMLKRSLERLIQLYTDKSHFVYELLQNAEDAEASRISFIQYYDRLEVMHDGKPFTAENLEGLCDIGKSDKTDNLNQIGEFGVGFKSVFGICDTVRLYSSPGEKYKEDIYQAFAVEIRDFTNPVDIDSEAVPDGYTTRFVFPYRVGMTFSGFKTVSSLNQVLTKRLTGLGFTTLLFMKNLDLIEYEIRIKGQEARGKYRLRKEEMNNGCTMITAVDEEYEKGKSQKEELFFLKFSRRISSRTSQTVDIAFAATIDSNQNIRFKKAANPYISVYFPTETESKLDFIIQGPFRTTPNRSSVPADDEDNIRLAKLAGDLLVESVSKLKQMDYLTVDLLSILPIEKGRFSVYPLFLPLYERTAEMFKEKQMLPTNNKYIFVDADHAVIARNNALMTVFPNKVISELYDDGKQYEWMPEVIKETGQYDRIHSYMVKELKISSLRPEDLRNRFKNNTGFLKSRTKTWLTDMYKLYNTVPNAFSESGRQANNMLETPMILTKRGNVVAPYRKVDGEYLPNVFLPITDIESKEIELVDPYCYEQCKDFFQHTLRLTMPDEYTYFIKSLYSRYNSAYFNVTFSQNVKDVKLVLKYLNIESRETDLMAHLENAFALKCHQSEKTVWVSPFEGEVMFPVSNTGIRIEDYFKGVNETISYVDLEDYENEGITYSDLKTLGVSDRLTVNDNLTEGIHELGRNQYVSYTWNTFDSGFRWKLNMVNITGVLRYISSHPDSSNSMVKSQTIFKTLQMNEAALSGSITILRDGYHYKTEEHTAMIIDVLRKESEFNSGTQWNGKWLYDNNNTLVSQTEISKHDLNQALYGKTDNDSELYEYLGFFKNEDDLYDEAVKEYDRLSRNQKESYFEIELQRRFGISADDLADQLNTGGTPRKNRLQNPLEDFEFPAHNVNNWRALRKHAAESLFFADSVTYQMVQRSVRVSKTDDGRAYILNMYRMNSSSKTACQMCHKPSTSIYATQIENQPDLELDQMYLSLCPNCSNEFRLLRNDNNQISRFLDKISSLTDVEIERNECVKVPIGNKTIWFTQTHIAEIAELLKLKEKAEQKTEDKPSSFIGQKYQTAVRSAPTAAYKPKPKPASSKKSVNNKIETAVSKPGKNRIEPTTPQVNVKKFACTPINAANVKNQNCIHTIDGRLIGKTVYLPAEGSYATVTGVNSERISFSVTDDRGRRKTINYYVGDCERFALVFDI